jgi:magnesium chelatase subunit I
VGGSDWEAFVHDQGDKHLGIGAGDDLKTQPIFPFSAVVDQEQAKEALLLAIVNPAVHGVLFLGEKGSGKTTLVRSLTSILPDSQVIEMPLGSTEDMVLGSVDAEKALATGKISVKPGILSRADGHVLYIDEVNLLPDHLVDVILDAAATGQFRLEREGVSAPCAARFVLVGSMNPEEGWLRPQLLDRFGLAVHVRSIDSEEERAEVFRRSRAFSADSASFISRHQKELDDLGRRVLQAKDMLCRVAISDELIKKAIHMITSLGVTTHRAELTTLQGALARAAWHARDSVIWEDIMTVMPFALQHRLSDADTQAPVTWDLLEGRLNALSRGREEQEKGWLPTPFFRKKKARNP